MANPLAGFSLPNAQDIQDRNRQLRQAQLASGNPSQQRFATLQTALDGLFGNPEEMRAKKVQDVLTKASQDTAPAEGDTDVDGELRRLKNMRDAVGSIDPSVADQITTRMLQLGQVKLEQNKLLQDTKIAASKESRDSQTFDVALPDAKVSAEQNAGEMQNYWRKKPDGTGIDRISVPKTDAVQRKQLIGDPAGKWVEGDGPKTEAEASDLLQKKTAASLEEAVIGGRNLMGTLASVSQKYDPSFLTLPTQVKQAANGFVERVTGKPLTPELAAQAEKYYDFRRTSVDSLNRYINLITGAAMGKQEEVRIRNGFPDAEKDGPTQFLTKLRSTMKEVLSVQRRSEQALALGLGHWDGEKLSTLATPNISEDDLDKAMEGAYGTSGREQSKAAAPAAGADHNARIDAIINGSR